MSPGGLLPERTPTSLNIAAIINVCNLVGDMYSVTHASAICCEKERTRGATWEQGRDA